MRAKNKLRDRLEALEIGKTIVLRGIRVGSKDYVRANSTAQRVRAASGGGKTFTLRSGPKNLTITRDAIVPNSSGDASDQGTQT